MPPPTRPVSYPFGRNPAQLGPRAILWGALAVVGLWAMFSCFSSVPADSVGVIIRMGGYHGEVPPGLVFKMPLGIDRLEIVPVQRQQKLEFGFGTGGATNEFQKSEEPEAETSMVTGDLNMALVEWVVQYRIENPRDFLFNVRDPEPTLRDASESAMREVIGDRTVDEVLTVGRQQVEVEALNRMQQLAKQYGLGVSVVQVQLKNVNPPRAVQASFNEVNQAQQEREQTINMANGEYNKAVPRARGEAQQRQSEAEGYALRRVNEARGDAEKFTAQLTEYLKAPEVTRQRLYLETMAEVLPQLDRKIIMDDKASRILPVLPLGEDGPPTPSPTPRVLPFTR